MHFLCCNNNIILDHLLKMKNVWDFFQTKNALKWGGFIQKYFPALRQPKLYLLRQPLAARIGVYALVAGV